MVDGCWWSTTETTDFKNVQMCCGSCLHDGFRRSRVRTSTIQRSKIRGCLEPSHDRYGYDQRNQLPCHVQHHHYHTSGNSCSRERTAGFTDKCDVCVDSTDGAKWPAQWWNKNHGHKQMPLSKSVEVIQWKF